MFDGHVNAATVGRHDDGNGAAVLTIQIEQRGLRVRFPAADAAVSGSLAGIVRASTAPQGPIPFRDRFRTASDSEAGSASS